MSFKLYAEPATAKDGTFLDSEGDTITILDKEARSKLEAAKNIKATSVFDNESEIEKFKAEYEKKILENRNLKYGEYIVTQGDTLNGISQKIYGTTKKWNELQVLNEEKLRNTTIKTGMKLRYIIYEKEKENVGENTDKKTGEGSSN